MNCKGASPSEMEYTKRKEEGIGHLKLSNSGGGITFLGNEGETKGKRNRGDNGSYARRNRIRKRKRIGIRRGETVTKNRVRREPGPVQVLKKTNA